MAVFIWIAFDQHYPTIMPLLLSVLQNAKGSEYHKLRLKAMECAGLVGKSRFFPYIVLPAQMFGQRLPLVEMYSERILASCASFLCKFKVGLIFFSSIERRGNNVEDR